MQTLMNLILKYSKYTIMERKFMLYAYRRRLSENYDTSLLHIYDFNLIMQGKICSAHAGLLIYLRKNLKYKILSICPQSTIWEVQFIEIIGNEKTKK